jgi:hypothetical protein
MIYIPNKNIFTVMKRNALFLAGLLALVTLFSCSKDEDPVNSFKFNGENYLINDLYLLEEIFDKGTASEMHVFQFMFGNISNGDTTVLAVALLDDDVNILGGNYPSLGFTEEAQRNVYPFGLLFISGISLTGDTYYLTGDGGSVDAKVLSNGLYSVKISNLSVGTYTSIGDNTSYEEIGTVTGSYEGAIHKEVEVLSSGKSSVASARLNSELQKIK